MLICSVISVTYRQGNLLTFVVLYRSKQTSNEMQLLACMWKIRKEWPKTLYKSEQDMTAFRTIRGVNVLVISVSSFMFTLYSNSRPTVFKITETHELALTPSCVFAGWWSLYANTKVYYFCLCTWYTNRIM